MSDAHDGVPAMFFDPRISPSDMGEIARWLGTRVDIAALQVIERSLLPKTVDADRIAAFALWAYEKVCDNGVGTYDLHRLTDVLRFAGAAERMALQELTPNECWAHIGRIAQRNEDHAGSRQRDRETTVKIARQAASFMDLWQRFSAPSAAPTDEADAEDIARDFGI